MTSRETGTTHLRDEIARAGVQKETVDNLDVNLATTETGGNRAQTGLGEDKEDFLAETDNL